MGLELTIVEIQQKSLHASIVLIGVFRPPQSKSQWFDLFNELTLHLLTRGKLIIMGDINVDIRRPTSYPANLIFNTMALGGNRPVCTAPTRVTQTINTCIDIIAVNEDLAVSNPMSFIEPPATIIWLQHHLFLLNLRSLHLLSNILLIKWIFLNLLTQLKISTFPSSHLIPDSPEHLYHSQRSRTPLHHLESFQCDDTDHHGSMQKFDS